MDPPPLSLDHLLSTWARVKRFEAALPGAACGVLPQQQVRGVDPPDRVAGWASMELVRMRFSGQLMQPN